MQMRRKFTSFNSKLLPCQSDFWQSLFPTLPSHTSESGQILAVSWFWGEGLSFLILGSFYMQIVSFTWIHTDTWTVSCCHTRRRIRRGFWMKVSLSFCIVSAHFLAVRSCGALVSPSFFCLLPKATFAFVIEVWKPQGCKQKDSFVSSLPWKRLWQLGAQYCKFIWLFWTLRSLPCKLDDT